MKHRAPYFSLVFLLTSFYAITASNLIQETCRKCAQTDPNISYKFCIASLEAAPDSHCANSIRELGIISINLTRQNVTSTRHSVKKLLKNKRLDLNMRACLNDCFGLYSDAIPTLKQAIKDYKSKHYEDANIEVSSVIDASTTCDNGFEEKGIASPITLRNNDTLQLSAIALSIINMLH